VDALDPTWATRARQVGALRARDFLRRWERLDDAEQAQDALRLRFRHKSREFLKYAFPGVFKLGWNAYHRAVLDRSKLHWSEQLDVERLQSLAPRGVGKSTIKKGDVAHSIVYGLRRFIIVICANLKDSKGWAATLKAWFTERTEATAGLWDLYGPFEVTGGKDRFTVTTRWGTKTTILCASMNTSLQGENEETHRPDEVVLDDFEDRKKVKNERIREEWQRKLNEEILKLRARDRGAVFGLNCTVNHPDAISQRIREKKSPNLGWSTAEFPAILRWPERRDLWDRCGQIYANLSFGDLRKPTARAFYEAHRAEMDRGAVLLDAAATPLFVLYEMIWCEGLAAFLREMQHQTRGLGDSIFESSRFTRCTVIAHPLHRWVVVNGRTNEAIPLAKMRKRVGRWDPSLGGPGGDYAALAVILRDSAGWGYVVDCWAKQGVTVSGQLPILWALAEKWGLSSFSLESNAFQALVDEVFRPQRKARQEAIPPQFYQLALSLDPSSGNKEERLGALEPAAHSGILQFADHLEPHVFQQFDDFDGIADSHHDDAHDAIEGGWARSGGMPPAMSQHPLHKAA
jgi:hypothetical protein